MISISIEFLKLDIKNGGKLQKKRDVEESGNRMLKIDV